MVCFRQTLSVASNIFYVKNLGLGTTYNKIRPCSGSKPKKAVGFANLNAQWTD